MFVAIVCAQNCVVVIMTSPKTKPEPDPGVGSKAVVPVVTNNANPGFRLNELKWTNRIKSFFVTIGLQGCLRTNKRLPGARPSEMARYCPSAMSECKESGCLVMISKFICLQIFMPRHILINDVFQFVAVLFQVCRIQSPLLQF